MKSFILKQVVWNEATLLRDSTIQQGSYLSRFAHHKIDHGGKKKLAKTFVKKSWKVFMQNKMQKRMLARALLKQQTRAVCFLSNADKPQAMFRSLHIEYLYRHK